MPAATYNFTIEKGTAFVIAFEYQDDTNVAINLTNWCARLRWVDNNGNIMAFNSGTKNSSYEMTIDPILGKVTLKIPASQTAAYDFTTASYDLELQEPNDLYDGGGKKIFRILQGVITLQERNVPDTDAFSCSFDSQDSCRTC